MRPIQKRALMIAPKSERAQNRAAAKASEAMRRQVVCCGCALANVTLRRVIGTKLYACGECAPRGVPTSALNERILNALRARVKAVAHVVEGGEIEVDPDVALEAMDDVIHRTEPQVERYITGAFTPAAAVA